MGVIPLTHAPHIAEDLMSPQAQQFNNACTSCRGDVKRHPHSVVGPNDLDVDGPLDKKPTKGNF